MERGGSLLPQGSGDSGHGTDAPRGPTSSPTTPTTPLTTNNCSENGSIGTIQQQLYNIARKFHREAPEQAILACAASAVTELQNDKTWLKCQLSALSTQLITVLSKLDEVLKASAPIVPQNNPQQPTWSTVVTTGLAGQPRSQRQASNLAAATALTALKAPPPYYKREIIVHCNKAAGDFNQPVQRLVEDLKRATSESEVVGQLQTVRKLQSGDTILRFDTTGSRDSWRGCEKDWIGALGVGAYLKQRHYTVLIHSMKKRECQDSAMTIAELYKVNPRLQEAGVRILRTAFQKKTLTSDKAAGPLLVSVAEPEQANEMVRQEINWRYQAHHCELFEGNARPTQCYKCHGFGHMAIHCRHAERCGFCSKTGHKPEDCIVKDDMDAHQCANCKGKHAAWHRECPIVTEQRSQAQVAFSNRPTRYRVEPSETPSSSAKQTPLNAIQYSVISPSITSLDDGATQHTTMPDFGEHVEPEIRNNGGATESAPAHGPQTDPKRTQSATTSTDQTTARKRARKTSQRYIYADKPPHTEETAFAEAIEAAKSTFTSHERSRRRGTVPAMYSQPSERSEDTEMTEATTIPVEKES